MKIGNWELSCDELNYILTRTKETKDDTETTKQYFFYNLDAAIKKLGKLSANKKIKDLNEWLIDYKNECAKQHKDIKKWENQIYVFYEQYYNAVEAYLNEKSEKNLKELERIQKKIKRWDSDK